MSPRLRHLLLTTSALLVLGSLPGAAGPDGANVVGGSANVQGQGTGSVIVNQSSDRAIINWNTFNIGTGESARFNQPGASSVILNRVIGGLGPSTIDGTLTANGRVFVVNGDGLVIGSHAVINTAGFLATTSDIKNKDFMAGRYNFNRSGQPDASIVNLGHITATSGGFAALVAPGVRNSGTISATLGTVALASGNMFTLDLYGDRLIQIGVGDKIASQVLDVATGRPLSSLVTNDGKLRANGGRVELTAAAARHVVDSVINTTGVIEANSVGRRNGMIVIGAATAGSRGADLPRQTVRIAGRVSAAGNKKGTRGGTIVVTGEDIQVANAQINASGRAGGGRVLIGGDWGGGNPTSGAIDNPSARLESFRVPTASTVSVDAASTIDASARDRGNGGKIVLWSDTATTFAGTIFARGGALAGDGGFVETSSHGVLAFNGTVDTRAPMGATGTLLLDPYDVTISNGATSNGSLNGGVFAPTGDSSVLNVTQLQSALATNNVFVTTGGAGSPGTQAGDIAVNANVSWNGNSTLTLSAFHNITIASGVTVSNSGAGNLVLRADNSGTGTGTVSFPGGVGEFPPPLGHIDFSGSTGTVAMYYNPSGTPTKYDNPTNFSPRVTGAFTAYMLVNNASDLSLIGTDATTLGGTYALGRNIDASTFTASIPGSFTGLFDGNGGLGVNYAIDHLPVGLFSTIGSTGTVRNLNLMNVNINETGSVNIGALASDNGGTVSNVVASGSITITPTSSPASVAVVGGLVADNTGQITQSSASIAISTGSATGSVGGLVGINNGTITQSSASGSVSGGGFLGGLAGSNVADSGQTATISQSSATGAVTADASDALPVGGLVGTNIASGTGHATINQSFATGAVTSSNATAFGTGGLVGANLSSDSSTATISQSFASGPVNGAFAVGGLVGANVITGAGSTATITQSFATGTVTSAGEGSQVGGLVGLNIDEGSGTVSITQSYATGFVTASSGLPRGLVGTNSGGTVTDSYWDIHTTGSGSSTGGIGVSTAQLQAALPSGFNSSVWSIVPGVSYPYLAWQFPSGTPQVVSGIAYVNHGVVPVTGGTVVAGVLSGSLLRSVLTDGPVTTGANGYYYYLLAPGTISPPATELGVGTFQAGTLAGATYLQNVAGSATGLDIYGTYLRGITSAGTLSALNAGLATAIGGHPEVAAVVNALPNRQIEAKGASFIIDQALHATGSATVTAAGPLTIAAGANITGTDVVLATPGAFINNAGSAAVTATNRWLIYSHEPSTNTFGNLDSGNTAIWNANATSLPPANVTAPGNRYIFAFQPTLTFTSTNLSKTYGDDATAAVASAFTVSGLRPGVLHAFLGDTAGTAFSGAPSLFSAGAASTASVAGSPYPINISAGNLIPLSGYTFAATPFNSAGLLTVDQRPLTISADARSRLYGDPNPALTFAVGGSGLVNGDTLSGALATTATVSSNVGAYPITQGTLAASNNYTITNFVGANLTVDRRPLTISADARSRLYGDPNPALTFAVGGSGLVNGDTLSGALATTATPTSNVGAYPITQGTLAASNNYTITNFVGANLTVDPRPLTISADARSRLYGDPNPALTFTVGGSGLVNGDTLSGALATTATPTSNVGAYPITQGTLAASNNYTITNFVGANLTVDQRPLTISADARNRLYGDPNPTLTFAVGGSGLVNGDTLSGALATTATPTSNVGAYPITQGTLAASNNYAVNFFGATLAVTPRPLTITADDASKREGQTLTFAGTEFHANGLVNADTVTAVTLTSSGAAAAALAANSPFAIRATDPLGSGLGNYAISFVDGTLTVNANPQQATTTQIVQQLVNQAQPPTTPPQLFNLIALNPPATPGGSSQSSPPRQGGPPSTPPNGNTPATFLSTPFFIVPAPGAPIVPNEAVWYVRSDVTRAMLDAVAAQLGVTVLDFQSLGTLGVNMVRINTGNLTVTQAVVLFSQQRQIAAAATANYFYRLTQDPAARTTETPQGDAGQYVLGKLRLSDIHRATRGTNVSIAVIDSQIDAAHPDLEGVVSSRFDATDTDEPPHAHGTGMAGAIASHRRLLGVAPGAQIIAIRAFSSKAASAESTTFNILRGIDYAINSGARIVNMSFAGPRDPSLERALKVAYSKGLVLIAAAGNAGPRSPPLYPAADKNVIAVTATDIDDKLFTGANRGPYIALAAPGVDILVPAPEGAYQLTTGTSVATAHISGIVALMLERNPKLTPDDIRKILTASAKRLGPNNEFGAGLVDPAKALRLSDPRSVTFTGAVTR